MTIKICFLGAGRRLSLFECFLRAGDYLNIPIELFSVENTTCLPIASVSKILIGPPFKDQSFNGWFLEVCALYKFNIAIPCFDSACTALSAISGHLQLLGVSSIVSTKDLCKTLEDKQLSEAWFKEHKINIPCGNSYPRIFKPCMGFGSRNHFIANSQEERALIISKLDNKSYIEQAFVHGEEYTIDGYITHRLESERMLIRKRKYVVAGEVWDSQICVDSDIQMLFSRILRISGFYGPITLQVIKDGMGQLFVIEINPRFGGGVTHSIQYGLDIPLWIIQESIGMEISKFEINPQCSTMVRTTRDIFL